MEKQKSIIPIFLGCYVFIQLITYFYSVFIGISAKSYLVDYGSIALNFLVGLFLLIYLKKKDSLIVLIALEFTLLADTGLIILDGVETASVFFFIFAQIFYAIRVRQYRVKLPLKWDIGIRISFILLLEGIAFLLLKEKMNWLVVFTLIYVINFVFNLIYAWINYKQNILFALGMLLFILCDLSLGLNSIENFIDITNNSLIQAIIAIPIDLVWMFYYPSQILIVLSMKYNRIENEGYYD